MRALPAPFTWIPFARRAVVAALACLLAGALAAGHARAAVAPGEDAAGAARAIAPAPGEQLPSFAARFAVEVPATAARAVIVAATAPFSTRDWTALPTDPAFHLADVTRGLAAFADLKLAVSAPTTVYWTVVTIDRSGGRLRAAAPRAFTVLPPFAQPVTASPYLISTRTGTLPALPRATVATPGATAGATGGAGAPRIRLASGFAFAPTGPGASVPAPAMRAAATAGASSALPADPIAPDGAQSYLVQFASAPGDDERAAIARAGGAIAAYIPDQAFLVRMTPAARERLAATGTALWIGDFRPEYKLSPLALAPPAPATGEFMALMFDDGNAPVTAQALTARGYDVEATSDNGVNKLVRFRAPAGDLTAAAGLSAVAWIEPVSVKTVENVNAQWIVQTNVPGSRRVWDMGLRGLGQIVMTSDSGIDVTHDMFRDPALPLTTWGDYPTHRKIIAYKPGGTSPYIAFGDHNNGNSYHGTHTACSFVGNDSASGGASLLDGMAKDAKIYFMDLSGPALTNSVVPFDDLNDLYTPPYVGNAGGAARVASNSWGSDVNGVYDLDAMQVDQFVWAHPDFYIAFSNGNAGAPGTVGSPATAKDCASIGGVLNGTSTTQSTTYYTTTSRGPTVDGRIKPTFLAPAQNVMSAQQGPSTYGSLSGTSMASPTGTGAVVLARQYLTDGWYPTGAPVATNKFNPSAALLKAMAINSADNNVVGYSMPDMNVGFGRIDLDNVLYFPGDARRLLLVDNTAGLGQGQYIEYQVNVVDGSQPLKVSLCWSDYPGSPAAAVQLVNNLNLTVTKGATAYKGNVFAGGFSTTGGAADTADTRNVEEEVLVNAPATGLWTVRVAAPTVPVGPQPFGLVVTGGVGQNAGSLALDRGEYGSTSTVWLKVVDANAGPSSVTVNVASSSEPAGEVVTLNGASGVFSGGLPLTPTSAVAADGKLSVSSGDVITATYVDASPAATLTATATVSFAQPTITYVRAKSQGAAGTLVTFNTPITAAGKVYYGLTPYLELGSVTEDGARTAHQVWLTGLTPGATYYYDVEATALNGNVVRDNLAGAHYKFTARANADVLLVLGEPNYPLLPAWESALSTLNYTYDEWSGSLADHPTVGDVNSGLRAYRTVLWQCGIDEYPPFSAEQQAVVTSYVSGGGRLATIGHDIGWALSDPNSGFSSDSTRAWLANTLHSTFLVDPPSLTTLTGSSGDPISGAYAPPYAPIPYTPVRSGAAGDEVSIYPAPGNASYTWTDNYTPGYCGFRWEDAASDGAAGTALWAALPSRLVTMYFEVMAADPSFPTSSAIRNDVVDKTILWLNGRPRPTAALTWPNGGETVTTNTCNVTWTETVGPSHVIAGRTIDYSLDGGDSWTNITTTAGPSPYTWDLSSLLNSNKALVRIRVLDDGAPALGYTDASNATFTIVRTGGDTKGPAVVAGSIALAPNPIVRPNPVSLTASATDLGLGASNVTTAEWAFGDFAPVPGTGQPLTVVGTGATVSLTGTLDSTPFLTGARKIWVRAKDAAGNWGPASSLAVQVNGPDLVGVGDVPTVAFLAPNAPNPFVGGTNLRFGLPRAGRADLAVYSVQGRLVRRLVHAELAAGEHVATWDRTDESGRRVASGVYYVALVTDAARFERRLVALP